MKTDHKTGHNNLGERKKKNEKKLKKPPALQNDWMSQIANWSRMMCRISWKLGELANNYSYKWLLSILKAAKIWRMCQIRNLESAKMSIEYYGTSVQ